MDAGSEFHGYSSDITRTWPVSGKFTDPQRELYELVLRVQKKCLRVSIIQPWFILLLLVNFKFKYVGRDFKKGRKHQILMKDPINRELETPCWRKAAPFEIQDKITYMFYTRAVWSAFSFCRCTNNSRRVSICSIYSILQVAVLGKVEKWLQKLKLTWWR